MNGSGSYKDAAGSFDERHPAASLRFPPRFSPSCAPLELSRLISFRNLHCSSILIRVHSNPEVYTLCPPIHLEVQLIISTHHVDRRVHYPCLLHAVRGEAEAELVLAKHHPHQRWRRCTRLLLSVRRVAPLCRSCLAASAISTSSSHRATPPPPNRLARTHQNPDRHTAQCRTRPHPPSNLFRLYSIVPARSALPSPSL